jgi:flagellar hook-associated protein 1 FlgK
MVDLAARPNEPATRLTVLNRAEQLAASFRQSAQSLVQARADINGKLLDNVKDINTTLDEIASLGAQISQAELSGQEASDLRDRRDTLVRELSTKLPITAVNDSSGGQSILLGGTTPLVSPDGQAHHLMTNIVAGTGDVRIVRITAGAPVDITSQITSGELGGMISARDGALTDAQNALDQLAFDTIGAYNGVHSVGYGLDGGTGRNLFAPSGAVAGSAIAMQVSADVAGAPSQLAAATDPNALPGDNRNALALQALADGTFANGGTQTASQALSSLVAQAGTALSSAMAQQDHAGAAESQLMQLRDQVSGVSLDDEMVDLMRFQRAYQASVKVVQTADEMLMQLLNMKR